MVRSISVNEPEVLRLHVDFNFGGRNGSTGFTELGPKSGDRRGMQPEFQEQFDTAGIEPVEGLVVTLVDERSDLNDEGVVCGMEVLAKLEWIEDHWRATWPWDAMTWVPSK